MIACSFRDVNTPSSVTSQPVPVSAILFRRTQARPSLFGFSAELNLGPTLTFFREELGGSSEEVRETVLANSGLLT